MSPELVLVAQIAIGLVFLRSSVGKLWRPNTFVESLADYWFLPRWTLVGAAISLIVVETAIAIAHLAGWLLPLAVPVGIGLLSVFLCVVLVTLRRGVAIRCLCFGTGGGEVVSVRTVIRLVLLLSAEIVIWPNTLNRLAPWELGLRDFLITVLSACMVLVAASWLSAIPDFVLLIKRCRTCGAKAAPGVL